MKKHIALLLALVMLFAMTACGNTGTPEATPEPTPEPVETEAPEETPEPEPEETPEPEPEETPEPEPEGDPVPVEPGEYQYTEATPFGEIPWTITLNEDGTAVVLMENPDMGNPTWTGTWVDNGDGTATTDTDGDSDRIAPFWNGTKITWELSSDGTANAVS